ncbi:acetyl-CoA synthetase-like protein [Rickenella mellea]|uniref:Acetyl-CoA synthetase-like protein n=1 Tax=Rickenella mellea TaxID=50990 RepID=A0A4Y7Q5Y8_9AGAM|nr:acetyl-CoA synthetase-like protein [Rickenella mellea]
MHVQNLWKFRCPQGVGSATFRTPPGFLDSRLSLPEVWDYHLDHSSQHRLFIYEDAPGKICTLTWGEAVRAVHQVGRLVLSQVRGFGLPENNSACPHVIGILAIKDTITSWALLAGIMRAGYQVFLISPKNSAIAVAHLLRRTNCRMIFISDDTATTDLCHKAVDELEVKIPVVSAPGFNDVFRDGGDNFTRLPPIIPPSLDIPAVILHSSGSTSFPKPIPITHKALAVWSLLPHHGAFDLCGRIAAAHSLPMFHLYGLLGTFWSSGAGVTISVFRPEDPPIIPTPERVLSQALATHSSFLVVVPLFLETWAQQDHSIQLLRSFDTIMFGGGPLQTNVGNSLVKKGVNLTCQYGSTEAGHSALILIDSSPEDWEYFELISPHLIHFRPEEGLENIYEPIFLASETLTPNVINNEVDGTPVFATNDLLSRHPSKPWLWKVYGRVDDQIIHSSGEKTNPGPLERIISQHPNVRGCIIFGRSQLQAGLLVHPVDDKSFDPTDLARRASFIREIWAAIEEANTIAPKHSRIFEEMVIVSHPGRPMQFTPKGTVRKKATLDDYAVEIAQLYYNMRTQITLQGGDILLPQSWNEQGCLIFVRTVVGSVLYWTVNDEDDIFRSGADSLQAMAIRNNISSALRASGGDPSKLSPNFVYANPSIAALAQHISRVISGAPTPIDARAILDAKEPEMQTLVEKVAHSFPTHTPSLCIAPQGRGDVVLVTGTTGCLGAHILTELARDPSVTRVYALNRVDAQKTLNARERQLNTLTKYDMDFSAIDYAKVVFLEGELSKPDLGLPSVVYSDLVRSLTCIIHNAWKVDFNIPLSSFEPLLQGVRNLVDLALASPLSSPPRFVFTSSVAVAQGWRDKCAVPEVFVTDPSVAIGTGYGESKWVAERILQEAGRNTPLESVVIRVGQLCGSTKHGSWNASEWFPSIVLSHKEVCCLPAAEGMVTWVPVDIAAQAIVEMRTSNQQVMHLVHLKPTTWSSIVKPIAQSLSVPTVPYNDWLAKLDGLDGNSASKVNASHLLEFYRSQKNVNDPDAEVFIGTRLEVREALKASKTLSDNNLPVLCNDDTHRWLEYWKRSGYM